MEKANNTNCYCVSMCVVIYTVTKANGAIGVVAKYFWIVHIDLHLHQMHMVQDDNADSKLLSVNNLIISVNVIPIPLWCR